jgi:hypothetical protein
MSEAFHSNRFAKTVWLTNHAIESMAKRRVALDEVQTLIEQGAFVQKSDGHGWIAYHFGARNDNLVCAAIVNDQSVIVKTVMVNWKQRGTG